MKLFLILLTLTSFNLYSAEINLYAINSPTQLNWTTPKSLLVSTIKNYARLGHGKRSRHKIGHAYLGFKCDGEVEVISGMTSGPGFGAKQSLFSDKVGMSVILMDNNGHFQDHEESLKDIMDLSEAYRVNKLQIEVSNEQCLEAKKWHADYSASESFIYGGVDKRPLLGEGSGCTAYAMSFFDVANVNFDLFNKFFMRTIFIPNNLLGGNYGLGKEVPVKTVLKDKRLLAEKTPNSLQVDLYDPNDMYNWIQTTWLEVQKTGKSDSLYEYTPEISIFNKMKILKLNKLSK